jgi:ABC-type bacteriocin/lantibiotic exporter with double-glycine peptidase domain
MVGFVTSVGSLDKTQRYLDNLSQTALENPDGTKKITPSNGSVRARGLTVRYNSDGPAILHQLDLDVADGQRVLLRGVNGSGKSTFLNAISGNIPYETGSLTLGGVEVKDTEASTLRKRIIHISQKVQLFDRTVYENIAYGTDASREQVQELLDRFDITFAELDTPVGKDGSNFSGGQRQIIYLLRAFLRRDAPLLLLDEPTAAFDPTTRDRAMRLLETIMEGRTTLFITHDKELIRYTNRVIEFKRNDHLQKKADKDDVISFPL